MATLKELITQIEQNPKLVKFVDPNQDYIFYKFYTIYWKEDNIIKSTSICIYIDNRDTPTESAYFKDSQPEILKVNSAPIPTPQEELLTAVKTKLSEITTADATIEKVVITNQSNDTVEVTAYKFNSATNSASKLLIVFYKDKDNALKWRKLT